MWRSVNARIKSEHSFVGRAFWMCQYTIGTAISSSIAAQIFCDRLEVIRM